MSTVSIQPSESIYTNKRIDSEKFSLPMRDWLYSLGFLLSYSLFSLHFPLGYLLVPVFLINSFVKNRYDFVIQVFLICGRFGFYDANSYPFKFDDILLIVSILCIFLLRKDSVLKKSFWLVLLYIVILVGFAMLSEESLAIQFRMMRRYIAIVSLFFPLVCFANKEFDIRTFYKRITGYALIICLFYIVDCAIFNGWVLLPGLPIYGPPSGSVYDHLICYPFSMIFPRKYPYGVYLLSFMIIPIARRYFRLTICQWVIILLAVLSTRTMSFMGGLIITYVIMIGQGKQILKYGVFAIIFISALYLVDGAAGGKLRVQSTVNQFIALNEARDEEDLSEFGTGRMAQIIPKMDVLIEDGRLMTGFGFLHPELTTISKYVIYNPLYIDSSKAEEVVTGVEVTQVQTVLDIGVLGLLIQTAFYIGLYFIIRPLRYSEYYLSVLIAVSIFGIGGFAGLCQSDGVMMVALSYSVVLLSNRKKHNTDEKQKTAL